MGCGEAGCESSGQTRTNNDQKINKINPLLSGSVGEGDGDGDVAPAVAACCSVNELVGLEA